MGVPSSLARAPARVADLALMPERLSQQHCLSSVHRPRRGLPLAVGAGLGAVEREMRSNGEHERFRLALSGSPQPICNPGLT